MIPTHEAILDKSALVPAPPVAIEAFWDGDTSGWYVVLTMLHAAAESAAEPVYQQFDLAVMRGEGGDLRLFNGQAPPWPEAVRAREAGSELAARLGIPFFFPSPDHPEDSCPRWWEQDRGHPCRGCGIPLLQPDSCPWRGTCYYCHLAEEQAKKDSQRSSEDLAGARCAICGNAASDSVSKHSRCPECRARYHEYDCSRCGDHVTILNTLAHTDICSDCDLVAKLDRVSEGDRQLIRAAAAEGGELAGVAEVKRILDWPLHDAIFAVRKICGAA